MAPSQSVCQLMLDMFYICFAQTIKNSNVLKTQLKTCLLTIIFNPPSNVYDCDEFIENRNFDAKMLWVTYERLE